METTIEKTPAGARVGGEMTIFTAAALKSDLLGLPHEPIGVFELDLSEITDFDTAGMQLLLMLKRRIQKCAGTLRIVACSGAVRNALELCRQTDLIADTAGEPTP